MDVRFPFENSGEMQFGTIYRPVAKASFQSPTTKKWVDIWMIVDTGADYTILPRFFADKLRVSFERDCVKDTTSGVGGITSVYFLKYKLLVRIGSFERNVPLAFFDNNEVPALLGRIGFLETFDTEFLKRRAVVFND